MTQDSARIASLTIETRIAAPPEAVWTALTDDISAWWPAEFYTGGDEDTRRFVLEARPGGRMYEDWGDGQGLLWATVNTVNKGSSLQVWGVAYPGWGGPSMLLGDWHLEPNDDGTLVRYTESSFGAVTEGNQESKDKGWRFLLDGALKAHLEGTPPPVWED